MALALPIIVTLAVQCRMLTVAIDRSIAWVWSGLGGDNKRMHHIIGGNDDDGVPSSMEFSGHRIYKQVRLQSATASLLVPSSDHACCYVPAHR